VATGRAVKGGLELETAIDELGTGDICLVTE
jgi:hypothetical protein